MNKFVSAVILAAGKSRRMGKDKILMNICDNPAILYTLLAFEKSEYIDEIVIVGTESNKKAILKIIKNNNISKFKNFVIGGQTRQESTFNGVNACSIEASYFAIHDGARILITGEEIEKVVKKAIEKNAAVLGVLVKDTIKSVDEEGRITCTPNRNNLWAAQTPQVFEKSLYLYAMDKARKDNFSYTDDSQLIEKMNKCVYVVEGLYSNIKLTTEDDIKICENVILGRKI